MGRKPDNGQPPGDSPRKIPSEGHRTEAAFSSFSEGAGLDFPGFASLSWADTEWKEILDKKQIYPWKTRTKFTALPERPRDYSHIKPAKWCAGQSSKVQAPDDQAARIQDSPILNQVLIFSKSKGPDSLPGKK